VKKFILVFLLIFIMVSPVLALDTYYGDSAGVTVTGTTSNYQVTINPSSDFDAGATYEVVVTVDDDNGTGPTTKTWQFTTTGASGPGAISCSTYTDGEVITGSQSVNISCSSTDATGWSWTATGATPSSDSGSTGDGDFTVSLSLPTSGLGSNLLSNPDFDTTDAWLTEGNWTVSGNGSATYTDGSSAYGLEQSVNASNYETYQGCLTPAVGSEGSLYFSQWGLVGAGNGITLSYTPGSEICDDIFVEDETKNHRIVASCAVDETMTLSSAKLQQKGTMTTINITTTNAGGSANGTIHLTHYTAGTGTATSLRNQFPYFDSNIPIDTNVYVLISNLDETVTSGSIDITVDGVSYACADGNVTCDAYSGEYGDGYDVTINPSSDFSYGKEIQVVVDADYLTQETWNFDTKSASTGSGTGTFSGGGSGSISGFQY